MYRCVCVCSAVQREIEIHKSAKVIKLPLHFVVGSWRRCCYYWRYVVVVGVSAVRIVVVSLARNFWLLPLLLLLLVLLFFAACHVVAVGRAQIIGTPTHIHTKSSHTHTPTHDSYY